MKAGSKTYLLLGFGGAFISLANLAELMSGHGDVIDVLAMFFFMVMSAEGFVSYLRLKGRTKFHLIS